MNDDKGFDPKKFYLGNLCRRGHDWRGTGQTLRQIGGGNCIECQKEWNRQKRLEKQGERKNEDDRKERYLANIEDRKENNRKNSRKYYEENRGKCAASKKERRNNPLTRERVLLTGTVARGKRRARKADATTVTPTAAAIRSLLEKCNHRCVYCDRDRELALEHFISLHAGGTDCIGNLVIACKTCNSSKGVKDPCQWFQTRSTFSQKRWKFILKLLGKTQENYNQIPLL